MLKCVITGISQDMDFSKNRTVTFVLLQLPNGDVLRAAIDESAAAAIIALQVATDGAPQPAIAPSMRAPAIHELEEEEASSAPVVAPTPQRTVVSAEEEVSVFGGQDEDTPPEYEEPPQPSAPPPVVQPPAPPAVTARNIQMLPNGKLVVPAKTVPRTSLGYPIVPNAGVDTDSFTGSKDRDEEGVGSV